MKENDYGKMDLYQVFTDFDKRLTAVEQKEENQAKQKEKKAKKYAKPYKPYGRLYGKPFIQAVLALIKKLDLPEDASIEELIEKLKELPEEELKKFTSELLRKPAVIRNEATGEIVGFRKDVVDSLLSELLLEGAITSEIYSDVRRILDAPETTGESVIAALPMEEQAYLVERQKRIDAAIELLKKKPEKPKARALFYE